MGNFKFDKITCHLQPTSRDDLPPGTLISFELHTKGDEILSLMRSEKCPQHLIIKRTTPLMCEMPTEFVLEKETLTLEEMIRKSTSLTAATFGIRNRGEIKTGNFADIIIFKPEELKDNATFEIPNQYAEGIHWMVLNGELVIEDGSYLEKLVGRTIRR